MRGFAMLVLIIAFAIVTLSAVTAQTQSEARWREPQVIIVDPPLAPDVERLNLYKTRFSPAALASKFVQCTVSKVYDGDYVGCTRRVRWSEKFVAHRYAGIDAPEIFPVQDYGKESAAALSEATLGKVVELEFIGKESIWGRGLVIVRLDGVDQGLEQVRRGAAWYYPQYARSFSEQQKKDYAAAMAEAKAEKRGLWGREKAPLIPADCRKLKRQGAKTC